MALTTYPGVIRNGKIEAAAALELPDGTEVYVIVPETVTEHVAKRKANGWLISDVGNLLMADRGSLVQTEKGWVWRFEVYVTAVSHDPWGPIGSVDVSVASGTVIDPEQTRTHLYDRGQSNQRPI